MSDPDNMLAPRRRILMADGTERTFPPTLIGQFDEIKELLGFPYAEFVRLPYYGPEGDWALLLDEEGKLKRNTINREATRLYLNADPRTTIGVHLALAMGEQVDVIVGNVAIVRMSDFKDDDEEDETDDD